MKLLERVLVVLRLKLNEYKNITLTVLRSNNTSKEISWVRTCKFTHKPPN